MKRALLVLLIFVLIVSFFVFELERFLTLESLKQSQQDFAALKAQSPWLVAAVGFMLYVIAATLSLPGALVMTLAMGALFGLVMGTVLVSFASSIGGTLAFLASRFVLRDIVQHRFGDKLKAVNDGVAKDGAWYLLTLRLIPVFPFFLINLLMGLTPMRTRTFYWVSQVGMLADTVVFVYAGTQLAQLQSLSGILSPGLLFSFVVLGISPMIAKKIINWLQRRRVYAKWNLPARFDRNLIVIGGGAGGLVSAYIAATVKAKVTLIEANKMGGDCLNYGCVPSKALIRSAKLAHQIRHADHYGLEANEGKFSFKKVMARVYAIIRTVAPHDSQERYTSLGVEVLQGYARITDPWTVEIKLNDGTTQVLTTRSIIIATGAQPFVPPLSGLEEVGYVTSETLWEAFARLDMAPARLVVLGGGPIGCELAQSFARLGSHVTQIEKGPRIMVREDSEVSELARSSLIADGVDVLTGYKAVRCEQEDGHKYIVVEQDGKLRRIEFDALLCAVGRVARLTGYGLEKLGIETQRTVVTNDYLETIYPNIFAAGDVTGPYQFTHTAAHQGWYATVNALFGDFWKFKADYSVIPWSTFMDPEIARVGLNEQEAQKQGIPYEVVKYGINNLDRAIVDGSAYGFIKVLTVPGKDKILGATIVGEHAGDLLIEFVLAMKHGLGLKKILSIIHIYPTLVEANKYAAGEWKRAHASQKVLAWLKRYHAWKRG
ncbi:MAG: Pyruvate/2-oxoglutarate dehydrogenase complex, dihydrolipoamide dehydrogenase (E3) component [Candidatus Nitrotoga sp. SPKER]|nr:MAG: Pyruvate/2-oxoglutarate dehydrogenase complex, dihydrolipoamide dehydrogenase (E3) component [Candidatus Nitrotoga sp. SPKER]